MVVVTHTTPTANAANPDAAVDIESTAGLPDAICHAVHATASTPPPTMSGQAMVRPEFSTESLGGVGGGGGLGD